MDEGREGCRNSSDGSTLNYVITPLGSSTLIDLCDDGCGRVEGEHCIPTAHHGHSNSLWKRKATSLLTGRLDGPVGGGSSTSDTSQHGHTPPIHTLHVLTPEIMSTENHHHKLPFSQAPTSTGGRGLHYSMPSSVDVKSSVTTCSELDFRKDLASLDANIARLQVQFKVALQPPN